MKTSFVLLIPAVVSSEFTRYGEESSVSAKCWYGICTEASSPAGRRSKAGKRKCSVKGKKRGKNYKSIRLFTALRLTLEIPSPTGTPRPLSNHQSPAPAMPAPPVPVDHAPIAFEREHQLMKDEEHQTHRLETMQQMARLLTFGGMSIHLDRSRSLQMQCRAGAYKGSQMMQ